MSRDWKPGDLAVLAVTRWPLAAEWPDDTSRVVMRLSKDGRYWNAVKGDPSRPFTMHVEQTDYYRELVTIDPEDREAVEKLRDLWDDSHQQQRGTRPSFANKAARGNCLQAALREFASPTPPKPDEPTGLGAVVEDADGEQWLRCFGTPGYYVWRTQSGFEVERKKYSDINAVRVLSVGVTE